ncbi:MAG: tripartite tricarboxylate transporter substrate binding protein [Proteobacteria bacterium]|nr:tripartite tricarboxylate transporter substrate binding protein [Burkholderiales bacterium]
MKLMESAVAATVGIGAVVFFALRPGDATAQAPTDGAYPARSIRMIVPFPPGGTADVLGRIAARRMETHFGQSVIVDNRPGASGHVGAEIAARAAGDGYTMMIGTIGIHAAHRLYRKLPYNPETDLQPIMVYAENPNVLVVNPSVPVKTVAEFLALARSRPGELNFGTAGPGSSIHMVTELFMLASGVRMNHIPYKGSGPALADLVGGQIQLIFENAPTAQPFVQSGRLRALAVTGARRAPSLPELPTLEEAGVKGAVATSWFSIAITRAAPVALVERLNAQIRQILARPDAADEFNRLSITLIAGTPAEARKFFAEESEKWSRVIAVAKIQLD